MKKEQREALLSQQIDQVLTEQIIARTDWSQHNADVGLLSCVQQLRSLPLRQPLVRDVLAKRLIHNKHNFSGEINEMLTRVYLMLGLHKESLADVVSKHRKVRLAAMHELYMMDIKVDESIVQPLLFHKDELTRKYARCFLIKHAPSASFEFLDQVKDQFLPWEQYELHAIMARRDCLDVPLFAQWIRSDLNPGVVSFSIKMAVHFKQHDAIPVLIRLLEEGSQELRKEAIVALGRFKSLEAEEALVLRYASESIPVKLEILKALGRIASGRCIHFLANVFYGATSVDIKKSAMRSLVEQGRQAASVIEDMIAEAKGIDKLVIQQSIHPISKH
ncbi:HEAT repeat domain-containing protein [Flavihumibacter rivuli]|uniref:HEAT repeat domain-containing protein n=1 Tax=Flavihumibacter rivuli TaxID=2838156 RepID=UPI001BDE3E6A|nr:HEAT repeat domain-containing protein [Flavihumibacter rivuli]ULQ56145.1 HEAT repeat domain-containing protein [Flavihumibacter rivuli]